MLKLLNLTLGFIFILVIVLAVTMKLAPNLIKGQIEREIGSRTGVATKIGSLQFLKVWPVTVVLRRVQLEDPRFLARISEFQASVGYSTGDSGRRWQIGIEITEPQVRLKEASPSGPVGPVTTPAPLPDVREKARDSTLDLSVHVSDGRIAGADSNQWMAEQIEFQFQKKGLMDLTKTGTLHLSGVVQGVVLGVNVSWPIVLDMPDLISDGILIRTAGSTLVVGGLTAKFNGASNLNDSSHNWQVLLDVPKLEELPQPPNMLPGSNFRGQAKISGDIQINAGVAKASGDVILKGLSGDLRVIQQGLEVEGPVRANLSTEFQYDRLFRLNHLIADVDMTDARVAFKDLFAKAQQVPLRGVARGSSPGQALEIESFGFEVAQIKGRLRGRVTPEGDFPANLSMEVSPTSLAGLEKVLLPLKASPVGGELDLQASYVGPLMDWRKSHIQATKIKLAGFSGQVNWKNQDESIELIGPVSASLTASGVVETGVMRTAALSGAANLQGLKMKVRDFYQKTAGQPLALDVNASATGMNQLHLKRLNWKTDWSVVEASGWVQNFAQPLMDLQLKIPQFSLSGFRRTSPAFQDLVPEGTFHAQMAVKGSYRMDLANWYEQNIRVTGALSAELPDYQIPNADEGAAVEDGKSKKGTAAKSHVASSFLPEGLLTKNLEMGVKAHVGKLHKPGLEMNGVSVDGQIKNGQFNGLAQVTQVFEGQVKLMGLQVPLLDLHPILQGTAEWSGLNMAQALAFAKPEMKDFASGKAAGQITFSSLMPSEPDFLARLTASGQVRSEPLTLNSVKIGEMLNEMLRKIPGLASPTTKTDSLKGWAQMSFRCLNKVLNLSQLRAMDADGSELTVTGTVQLEAMTAQLSGKFFWSRPTIKGCLLEGNRDSQGRMQIPITLAGPLMQPRLSLVGNLLSQLAGNALKCELKGNLKDNLKEKLKGLLGN